MKLNVMMYPMSHGGRSLTDQRLQQLRYTQVVFPLPTLRNVLPLSFSIVPLQLAILHQ